MCRLVRGTHLAFSLIEMPDTLSPTPRPQSSDVRPKRSWALYLVVGLFAALMLTRPAPTGARISYSEFKQRLEAGQVADVEIAKDRLRVTPSDAAARTRGERWLVTRVDDPELVKQLDAKHASYHGTVD